MRSTASCLINALAGDSRHENGPQETADLDQPNTARNARSLAPSAGEKELARVFTQHRQLDGKEIAINDKR